jgi:hypothetical protein
MVLSSLKTRRPALALRFVLLTNTPDTRADDRLIEPTFAAVQTRPRPASPDPHSSMPAARFQHLSARTRSALTPPGRHAMTA